MNERSFCRQLASLFAAALLIFAVGCSGDSADTAAPDETAAVDAPVEAAANPEYLYVASQSGPAVSIINMDTRELVETIWLTDLGFSANAKPHHAAVEPDGSFWYLSLIADGRVLKFNRDNELVGQVEFETPGMLAIDPESNLLYVGRSMAAVNPPQRIGVVNRTDMTIDEYDVFFPRPHAIAAAPGGAGAFTASLAENQMAYVDPAEDILELVNVDGAAHQMFVQFAVSPDHNLLVTGGQMSGEISVFEISDPSTPTPLTTLPLGGQPWHPTFSPDGRFVYFPQRTENAVAVIDTSTWEVVHTIRGEGLVEPHGSAISTDGRTLWVSGRNTEGIYPTTIERTTVVQGDPVPAGTVVAIDTETFEIVAVIEVPAYAAGIGARSIR